MRIQTERRGFALAVSVCAIVVIGALIAGAFFASNQEYRLGGASFQQTQALAAADMGLTRVMTSGFPKMTSAPNGSMTEIVYGDVPGAVDTVRVTKLTNETYLVVSEAFVGPEGPSQARRRTGALLRLNIPQFNILAALTTRQSTRIGGSSLINGNDTSFTGWGCAPPGPPLAGIAIPDANQITTSGCNNLDCVEGTPKISQDPRAADDSTYFSFGGIGWAELTQLATQIYSGPQSGTLQLGPVLNPDGTCDENARDNWGDPQRNTPAGPCEGYFPIIYAQGDMKFNGGMGQGILLVEGDLEVTGGAQFYGPVIVKGRLKTMGTGGHFNGGVMAANVELDQNVVLGNAVIRFSRCAIAKAIAASAPPTLMRDRAWMELF